MRQYHMFQSYSEEGGCQYSDVSFQRWPYLGTLRLQTILRRVFSFYLYFQSWLCIYLYCSYSSQLPPQQMTPPCVLLPTMFLSFANLPYIFQNCFQRLQASFERRFNFSRAILSPLLYLLLYYYSISWVICFMSSHQDQVFLLAECQRLLWRPLPGVDSLDLEWLTACTQTFTLVLIPDNLDSGLPLGSKCPLLGVVFLGVLISEMINFFFCGLLTPKLSWILLKACPIPPFAFPLGCSMLFEESCFFLDLLVIDLLLLLRLPRCFGCNLGESV